MSVFWPLAACERNLRSSSAAPEIPLYWYSPNGLQRAIVSTPESSDTHFFHSFSIVLGILVAFAIVLFGFARVLGKEQNAEQLEDPLVKRAAQQNTMPFGHEAVAGQNNSAPAAAPAPPPAGAAAVSQ
jgi:hypothetical protein